MSIYKAIADVPQPIGYFVNDDEWELKNDWQIDTLCGRLTVFSGFRSDGASIPRFLWSAVGPRFAPSTFAAALAHDALYSAELPHGPGWRAKADAVFLDLLERLGVSYIKRQAYFRAVRLFGGIIARQHTSDSIAEGRRFVFLQELP